MTKEDIAQIIQAKTLPYPSSGFTLVETHISWVVLGDTHVYKIKKPVSLSFLDFSTLEKRKWFCEQEVHLNRRLAPKMYLGVLPVKNRKGTYTIGGTRGITVDYAVLMKRMDETRQLDVLLQREEVSETSIIGLAGVIADFHRRAEVVPEGETWQALYEEFEDITSVREFLGRRFGEDTGQLLDAATKWAYGFLEGCKARIEVRNTKGFVIDGHGDLHCRNIFLLDPPVIFDCIEFNEAFRKLDMLNEVAFLCMDLERFGRTDLAELFCQHYFDKVPCLIGKTDEQLFLFYKMHRANVRIKVHAIRISELDSSDPGAQAEIHQLKTYLQLFRNYFNRLKGS